MANQIDNRSKTSTENLVASPIRTIDFYKSGQRNNLRDEICKAQLITSSPIKGSLARSGTTINSDINTSQSQTEETLIDDDENPNNVSLSILHYNMLTKLITTSPSLNIIQKLIQTIDDTESTDKEQKDRFADYDKSILSNTENNREKITGDIYETIKEKSVIDIPTASLYRALRNEIQKFIRIDHHEKSLQACIDKGRIPLGLSLSKKLNVINTRPQLEIDIRRIQYRAEIATLDRLLRHYRDIRAENRSAVESLDALYYKLEAEERVLIRSKTLIMAETLTLDLKRKRSKKINPKTDINTKDDEQRGSDDIQPPPLPQRKFIRGRRRFDRRTKYNGGSTA